MAKFIMLDHSLYGVGGHHYAYAANVLRAAEAMGNEIVLITHANFRAGRPAGILAIDTDVHPRRLSRAVRLRRD